jgi:hypothetical protein
VGNLSALIIKIYSVRNLVEERGERRAKLCRNLPGFGEIIFQEVRFEENRRIFLLDFMPKM